jgi:predicted NBD/HSP70 family sugar kinase
VWDTYAYHLAIGLNNLLVLWSPDAFVLGGSVMNAIPLDTVRAHLRDLVSIYTELPPILAAQLKEEAGFSGGLALLRSQNT